MPYGEKSAYDVFSSLKKKSPAYKKSSGFKMKSPLTKFEMPNLSDKMPTSNLGIAAGVAGIGALGYLLGKKNKKGESHDRTR